MDKLFNPNGIAVVGASANPGKAGYVAIRNMREKEYPGKVFPINPKEKEILGYPCHGSLADIEENVDLVVLIMPSRLIYDVMDDLNRRMETKGDVKFIVCAAADYAETKTEEGIARQKRLMETAEKYHIRVIGPNCIGVIDNRSLVDTTFVDTGVPFSTFGAPTGITFVSRESRSQFRNRRLCLQKIHDELARRARPPKVRHKTKPTRASKERRLASKRLRSQVKKLRRRPTDE